MTNIGSFDPIAAGTATSNLCLATVVSDNFTKIAAAITALDSDNYAPSSVLSQHVSTNAILSQHISTSQVVSAKISAGAIVEPKVDYSSADAGVMAVRYGDASGNAPANGIMAGRYSNVITVASDVASWHTESLKVSFSQAIDGNPGYTAVPIMGEPIFIINTDIYTSSRIVGGNHAGPQQADITALDSVSVVFVFRYRMPLPSDASHVATVNFIAEGPT